MARKRNIDVDVLKGFPDLTRLGSHQLQVLCDAWLRQPIAKECAVAGLQVRGAGPTTILTLVVAPKHTIRHGEDLYFPMDSLLGYLMQNGIQELSVRQKNLEILKAKRKSAGPQVYQNFVFDLGGEGAVEHESFGGMFVVRGTGVAFSGNVPFSLRSEPGTTAQIARFTGLVEIKTPIPLAVGDRGYLALQRDMKGQSIKRCFLMTELRKLEKSQKGNSILEFMVDEEMDGPFESKTIEIRIVSLTGGKPLQVTVRNGTHTRRDSSTSASEMSIWIDRRIAADKRFVVGSQWSISFGQSDDEHLANSTVQAELRLIDDFDWGQNQVLQFSVIGGVTRS